MAKTTLSKPITGAVIALSLLLVTASDIPIPQLKVTKTSGQPTLIWANNPALANTSGGRAKGGSFDDEPESDYSSSRNNRDYNNGRDYNNNRNGNQEPMGFFGFLILLVVLGMMYRSGALAEIMKTSGLSANALLADTPPTQTNLQTVATATGETTTYQLQSQPTARPQPINRAHRPSNIRNRTAARRFSNELTNNTVTITQLQVGMLASARHVQQALNQMAAETDMSTKKGLTKSLRETVLALLRSPDTWSHVSAQSKKCRTRQDAKESFEALSLEERSRFTTETLSNENGNVRIQKTTAEQSHNAESADYIVVTLIIGTAHDKPLIDKLSTTEDLRAALKTIGSITPEYLMVYEVLWSPQDESDSLTDDEMLLNYPHMFNIA